MQISCGHRLRTDTNPLFLTVHWEIFDTEAGQASSNILLFQVYFNRQFNINILVITKQMLTHEVSGILFNTRASSAIFLTFNCSRCKRARILSCRSSSALTFTAADCSAACQIIKPNHITYMLAFLGSVWKLHQPN